MYEVGKVYVWQNQVGDCEYLNGSETTVIRPLGPRFKRPEYGIGIEKAWETDTKHRASGYCVEAYFGELRPKNPPPGEQLVRDLFEPKPAMVPA
jgi:hypothetical protein